MFGTTALRATAVWGRHVVDNSGQDQHAQDKRGWSNKENNRCNNHAWRKRGQITAGTIRTTTAATAAGESSRTTIGGLITVGVASPRTTATGEKAAGGTAGASTREARRKTSAFMVISEGADIIQDKGPLSGSYVLKYSSRALQLRSLSAGGGLVMFAGTASASSKHSYADPGGVSSRASPIDAQNGQSETWFRWQISLHADKMKFVETIRGSSRETNTGVFTPSSFLKHGTLSTSSFSPCYLLCVRTTNSEVLQRYIGTWYLSPGGEANYCQQWFSLIHLSSSSSAQQPLELIGLTILQQTLLNSL